jgi:hypothetical protein
MLGPSLVGIVTSRSLYAPMQRFFLLPRQARSLQRTECWVRELNHKVSDKSRRLGRSLLCHIQGSWKDRQGSEMPG